MKRFAKVFVLSVVGVVMIGLSACNTTRGAGEDIEKGGAALKHSAEKHGAD